MNMLIALVALEVRRRTTAKDPAAIEHARIAVEAYGPKDYNDERTGVALILDAVDRAVIAALNAGESHVVHF